MDLNISYLMRRLSERSILNVGRVRVFVTSMISEPGDHHLSNLLLCSSNISDEQYLSFFVCRYDHFIVYLLLVSPINDTYCAIPSNFLVY